MSNRFKPRATVRVVVACLTTVSTIAAMSVGASAQNGGSGASGAKPAATTTTAVPITGAADGTSGESDRSVVEASVASLRRDRSQVSAELATASSARAQQFNEWALNHLAVDAAQTEVNRTLMLAEQARRDVLAAEDRVRAYATDAFMNPPALASMSVLSIADADQMSWAHDVLSLTADDQSRVVDELAAAEVLAQRRSADADKAATAAQEREAREKDELDRLEAAEARQAALVAEVDGRLDHALGEVAALDAVDRQAAKELEEQERGLAEEAKAVVAGSARGRAGSSASPATKAASTPTPTTAKPPTVSTTPSGPPPAPPSGTVTWSDVTKVGSFWVNQSIASQVRSLLNAASAAGFSLSGGGFRDPAEQISLRQAHCGPTYYDIYQRPASQCTPPTAQPGRSMHERGLALDIKSSGSLITSRSNPAYQWLAANASSYGFYNLPSEPWHWSTNGN